MSANKSKFFSTQDIDWVRFSEAVKGGLWDEVPGPSLNIMGSMAIKDQTINMASQENRHAHKNIYKQN